MPEPTSCVADSGTHQALQHTHIVTHQRLAGQPAYATSAIGSEFRTIAAALAATLGDVRHRQIGVE